MRLYGLTRSVRAGLLALSLTVLCGAPSLAQAPPPQVSVVTLHVQNSGQGQQVVTPKGYLVPLPGAGVNGEAIQIYIGANGGYWYVDKNGQTVDLTGLVNQVKGAQQTTNVPQYAPVYNQPSQSSQSSSGGGGSGAATAAMAGLGAMAGSAMADSMYYHNVPYGTPMYYGAGGNPYYMNNGHPVNISNNDVNLSPNQQAYLYNQHKINQDQQQQWYQNHQQNKTAAYQSWQQQSQAQTQNPFVHSNYQGGGGAAAAAEGGGGKYAAEGGGGKYAAGGGEAEGGGGRFGRRGGGDADGGGGGGRFGRRGGGDSEGGGGGGLLGRHKDDGADGGGALGGREQGREAGGAFGGDGDRGGGLRGGGGGERRGRRGR